MEPWHVGARIRYIRGASMEADICDGPMDRWAEHSVLFHSGGSPTEHTHTHACPVSQRSSLLLNFSPELCRSVMCVLSQLPDKEYSTCSGGGSTPLPVCMGKWITWQKESVQQHPAATKESGPCSPSSYAGADEAPRQNGQQPRIGVRLF